MPRSGLARNITLRYVHATHQFRRQCTDNTVLVSKAKHTWARGDLGGTAR